MIVNKKNCTPPAKVEYSFFYLEFCEYIVADGTVKIKCEKA